MDTPANSLPEDAQVEATAIVPVRFRGDEVKNGGAEALMRNMSAADQRAAWVGRQSAPPETEIKQFGISAPVRAAVLVATVLIGFLVGTEAALRNILSSSLANYGAVDLILISLPVIGLPALAYFIARLVAMRRREASHFVCETAFSVLRDGVAVAFVEPGGGRVIRTVPWGAIESCTWVVVDGVVDFVRFVCPDGGIEWASPCAIEGFADASICLAAISKRVPVCLLLRYSDSASLRAERNRNSASDAKSAAMCEAVVAR